MFRQSQKNRVPLFIYLALLVMAICFFASCEKSTDGPLEASDSQYQYGGEGFFTVASLDSGRPIHLTGDTLRLMLGKIWSFSNCALQSIKLEYSREDSVLIIKPKVNILVTEQDCPSPYYRPDTILRILTEAEKLPGITQIQVKNNADTVLDSIMLRRGEFKRDTFRIYLDSAFADAHNYPLRTKEKKSKKEIPTILRVLDSLTPQVLYWRTMETKCTHRVDMCKSVVADTLYPSYWQTNDTSIVPIRYACADTDSVYCIASKWENDSLALGPVQEREDTVWHYSTYYVENIPECATYSSFAHSSITVGQRVQVVREMMVPDSTETSCGPGSQKTRMVYNLRDGSMVLDTGSVMVLDTLAKIWKAAKVASDTAALKTE